MWLFEDLASNSGYKLFMDQYFTSWNWLFFWWKEPYSAWVLFKATDWKMDRMYWNLQGSWREKEEGRVTLCWIRTQEWQQLAGGTMAEKIDWIPDKRACKSLNVQKKDVVPFIKFQCSVAYDLMNRGKSSQSHAVVDQVLLRNNWRKSRKQVQVCPFQKQMFAGMKSAFFWPRAGTVSFISPLMHSVAFWWFDEIILDSAFICFLYFVYTHTSTCNASNSK